MTVHVRGKRSEVRALNNYDNKHSNIVDTFAEIMAAHRGTVMVNPREPSQHLKIDKVHRKSGCVYAVVEPGRNGLVSRLEKLLTVIHRDYGDTEFVPLRQMLVYKPGQHQALLLMEKAGVVGSKTLTHLMLQASFQRKHTNLGLAIDPAVSEEAVRRVMDKQPIKSLVFHRINPTDATGKTLMLGEPVVQLEVRMTPPRRKFFSRQSLKDNTVSSESLLGVLAPVIHPDRQGEAGIASVNEEGWQSALELKMPNGTTRTVNVTRQDAITLSFPIEVISGEDDRPTDDDFQKACVAAVEDLAAGGGAMTDASRMLGFSPGDGALCHTDGAEVTQGTDWEVIWGVNHDGQRASSQGSVSGSSEQ